jgi:hypothetical protein
MKCLAFLLIAATIAPSAVSQQANHKQKNSGVQNRTVILSSESGSFLIEGPNGWIADRRVGRRLGVCCVYYPKGSLDTAETVIYPNIVTKSPGRGTLKELMDADLAKSREDNPGMSYVDGQDIPLQHGRTAKLRYFHGLEKRSSEAVAYIDEEKIIALVVLSSKTEKGLSDALPLLRKVLDTYVYGVKAMDAKPPS